MYYEIIKRKDSRKWVLFIHGIGGSIKTWKYQIEDFSDYNLILIDLQGHGRSGFDYEKDMNNLHRRAGKLIADILDKEHIRKVDIVALSLGTITAMEFMYLYPERVKSAVLGGCIVNLQKFSSFLLYIAEKTKNILPVKIIYPIFAFIIMPKAHHAKSRHIFVREALKMKKDIFCSWISAVLTDREQIERYADICNRKNVLFITGTEDYVFRNGVVDFGKKIDNFRIKYIKRCGHACSIEKHKEFDRIALHFLKNGDIV